MTQEEALRILNISDPEDAQDAYELAIFELRKFLQQQAVFFKTHQNQLSRLRRAEEAYLTLGGIVNDTSEITAPAIRFPDSLLSNFLSWHEAKNFLRAAANRCFSSASFGKLSARMLQLELDFALLFENWPDDFEVKISQPQDVMQVLAELRQVDPNSEYSIDWFANNHKLLPEVLRRELKRLSLLPKYLKDE